MTHKSQTSNHTCTLSKSVHTSCSCSNPLLQHASIHNMHGCSYRSSFVNIMSNMQVWRAWTHDATTKLFKWSPVHRRPSIHSLIERSLSTIKLPDDATSANIKKQLHKPQAHAHINQMSPILHPHKSWKSSEILPCKTTKEDESITNPPPWSTSAVNPRPY